ncbi:MAG: hypothetical protein WBQ79_08955 [Acidobacteriaceae bacterium]
MGFMKRTFMFWFTRWLAQRRWGRRLLFFWALRAMRTHVRQFVRDIADLYPAMRPATAWI